MNTNQAQRSPATYDLFGAKTGEIRQRPQRQPLEMKLAGALCRQIRRKTARHEKQRIAHLICLNLVSLLKQSSTDAHS